MPYYKIDRHKVFLSHDRWQNLNQLAMAHKDPVFRVSSMMAGHKAAREAEELRVQYLNKLYREDSYAFVRDWVVFDLTGRKAQENAWDLLWDYCALSRVGYLVDTRSDASSILSDFSGESYMYPMGRVFSLRCKAAHTVLSLFHLRSRPMITLEINTCHIVRAFGTLEDFELQLHHCTFQCSRLLNVVFTNSKKEIATED